MGKKNDKKDNIGDIVLYETEDGLVSLEVNLQDDTIWLNMDQIATLYCKAKSTISEHIQDIFKDGELVENEVMKKFGNSEFSKKPTNYYCPQVMPVYAVKKGEELNLPVYKFLREPLIRRFGKEWYDELEALADELRKQGLIT